MAVSTLNFLLKIQLIKGSFYNKSYRLKWFWSYRTEDVRTWSYMIYSDPRFLKLYYNSFKCFVNECKTTCFSSFFFSLSRFENFTLHILLLSKQLLNFIPLKHARVFLHRKNVYFKLSKECRTRIFLIQCKRRWISLYEENPHSYLLKVTHLRNFLPPKKRIRNTSN